MNKEKYESYFQRLPCMIDVHVEYPTETAIRGGLGYLLLEWIASISFSSSRPVGNK